MTFTINYQELKSIPFCLESRKQNSIITIDGVFWTSEKPKMQSKRQGRAVIYAKYAAAIPLFSIFPRLLSIIYKILIYYHYIYFEHT